jgi:chromosome segregation ATPase
VRSDFDDAIDQLYGLPPAQFVAAREDLVKAARSAGDRQLAAAIHALRRPTAGAWMVNLLARERPDVLRQLVELGAELRKAQEELRGEDLRALTTQRQEVVAALVKEARTLARQVGEKPGEESEYGVERTLLAALADPHVGEQVATGALVRPLDYAGFGPVPPADVVERPRSVRSGDRPATEAPAGKRRDEVAAARLRRERAEAEAALREAEVAQRQAAALAKRAAERAAEAGSHRREADAEIGRLSRELHAAQAVAAAAQDLERHARTKATEAAADAEEAAARHAEARSRLEELTP